MGELLRIDPYMRHSHRKPVNDKSDSEQDHLFHKCLPFIERWYEQGATEMPSSETNLIKSLRT